MTSEQRFVRVGEPISGASFEVREAEALAALAAAESNCRTSNFPVDPLMIMWAIRSVIQKPNNQAISTDPEDDPRTCFYDRVRELREGIAATEDMIRDVEAVVEKY